MTSGKMTSGKMTSFWHSLNDFSRQPLCDGICVGGFALSAVGLYVGSATAQTRAGTVAIYLYALTATAGILRLLNTRQRIECYTLCPKCTSGTAAAAISTFRRQRKQKRSARTSKKQPTAVARSVDTVFGPEHDNDVCGSKRGPITETQTLTDHPSVDQVPPPPGEEPETTHEGSDDGGYWPSLNDFDWHTEISNETKHCLPVIARRGPASNHTGYSRNY